MHAAKRPLGRTGLSVTPIGLGLAALGRPAYINLGRDVGSRRTPADLEQRTHEMLDAAYAAGVRYFDAARSYGRAEEFLASWLGRHPEHVASVTVGSKWGYRYVGEWNPDAEVHEIRDHSPDALHRQWAESRQLLGPSFHLYQIHSATLDSGVLDDRRVLSHLIEVREQGVVVGLSTSGPAQRETIERALEVDVDGDNPFQCVQATWNLLESSVAPALASAAGRGWGVIIKEALANGRLAVSAPDLLDTEAGARGVGPDAVAISAALAQPWAHVVLSGASSPHQLAGNLTALQLELSTDDLERLSTLAEPPDRYWSTRSSLQWT
jgi:aryl-alcohol dehydrogenase-like predicted oxidoreductase